jgi:DNA polymerase epsilon subunit 1
LGGIEDDRRPTEELPTTEFMMPGAYSNVCLSMSVRNLAINSVLHSVLVNELEGSGGTTAFDSVSKTLDEYKAGESQRDLTLGESQMSPHIFGVMRSMVRSWLVDKIQSNGESPATVAVDHFWRWICSSSSALYDPSIHRFIHGLMRKTFIQLLAEFRRLGSQVVYADFSRIIVATSKPPGTAFAYAKYLTTAASSHELFQHIYLNTDRFYDSLLFMDQANMGGVVCEDPGSVGPPTELALEMQWNIEQFLPPAIQPDFRSSIQYFIVELYKIKQRTNDGRAPLRPIQNATTDNTTQVVQDEGKQKESEATRESITGRLTRKSLKVLGGVQERYREAMTDMTDELHATFQFPILPGSHLHLSNLTLEFVKFVCAVYGLHKEFQVEVGLLKRNLLELANVREFASEAIFRNPCEPLRLHNVPCKHCDYLRDFDFCRDPKLLPNGRETVPRWTCFNCGGEYDRLAIELSLMEVVYSLERNFTQQDLKCTKCKQIRSDGVSRFCQCSGTYALTLNKVDAKRKLKTIVNVAIVHNLIRLKVRPLLRPTLNYPLN